MIDLKTDFQLESTTGTEKTLKDYSGKNLVLYFYPRDNTKGCTIEANEFTEFYDEFKKLNTEIVGISKDTVKSHLRFQEKQNIPFELLADPEREIHKQYEVLKPAKMYGKDVIKTIRSTFVFDEKGELLKEFRDVKSSGHAEEVLEFVKSL